MNTCELNMVKRHLNNGYSANEIAERLNVHASEVAAFIAKQNEKQQKRLNTKQKPKQEKVVKKDINARFRGVTV